jgi:phenylpropionate dioxygenase-like ring-hydroxylating dioxygenase large terminal subunit
MQDQLPVPVGPPKPPVVLDGWYILCRSHELREKPIRRSLYGTPIALWRQADGTPAAVVDRCPHRSVPLSGGRVVGGRLECPYHGWQFDADGHCKRIPAFLGEPDAPGRRAARHAVVEQQGFVWVWGRAGASPSVEPFRFPHADAPGWLTVRHEVRARASVHQVAENALDVPHTAFLHGGLFRKDGVRNRIRCVLERFADHAVCEYIGEPRPEGLAAKILAPSGGVVKHFDRFFLPSIVQVEYQLGEDVHLVLNGACTPVDAYDTRMYAVVTVKSRIPRWLVRPLVQPIALYIFGQDAVVLARQTDAIAHFGDEAYASTDVDLLGPHILRLMRRAERGEAAEAAPMRREVEMDV